MYSIEYYSEQVQAAIMVLPRGLRARYAQLTESMVEFGANLGMPHTQPMGNGLFELRVKGLEGIARVFYCTMVGKRIIMLHSFVKKSQKTPKKELELARRRLEEIKAK